MIKTVSFSVKLTFSVLSHETHFEDIKQARLAQFLANQGVRIFQTIFSCLLKLNANDI